MSNFVLQQMLPQTFPNIFPSQNWYQHAFRIEYVCGYAFFSDAYIFPIGYGTNYAGNSIPNAGLCVFAICEQFPFSIQRIQFSVTNLL